MGNARSVPKGMATPLFTAQKQTRNSRLCVQRDRQKVSVTIEVPHGLEGTPGPTPTKYGLLAYFLSILLSIIRIHGVQLFEFALINNLNSALNYSIQAIIILIGLTVQLSHSHVQLSVAYSYCVISRKHE